MARRPAEALPQDESVRREVYVFALYRVLEASLLALIFLGPHDTLFGMPRHPYVGQALTLFYLPASLLLLAWARQGNALRWHLMAATFIDVVVGAIAIHAIPAAAPGIAMMVLFNIGAAALLLPLRYGVGAALLGALALMLEFVWARVRDGDQDVLLAERLMFSVSYLAFATLTHLLGRRMRRQQALAERRGAEVADMAALNELIIRRMRTGVLLVDGNGRIRMANEAAVLLLGQAGDDARERDLADASPALAERLAAWRRGHEADPAPLPLGDEQVEVLPRFVQLLATSHSTLVFLDDASLVSRRAESLTLATMGRFSASLAHEIRNPLAAISYATQLLEESQDIGDADRRLLQIVHQQCQRTNGIVESVLGLARRERAQPEHVDLGRFVRRFVDDYRQTVPEENGQLRATVPGSPVAALFDPRHLQQVLTVLVNNALHHGRMPGEPARVSVNVYLHERAPAIDVLDRGPGISPGVLAQLFRPFFTTSDTGTGLGLYIARELCRANGASLDYVGAAGGGGCFRIAMSAPQALLGDRA